MRIFAQIDNGRVTAMREAPEAPPVVPEGRVFIDVTDRPGVSGGDAYDAATDTFTPPPPPPDLGDTVDVREFMMLFTAAERKAIRNAAKADDDVADFMELVRVPVPIRLKHPVTIAGLSALVAKSLLTAPRAAAIQNRRSPQ